MQKIKVETILNANIEKVWKDWNDPDSIKGWAFASETWECPYAENDLRVGGRFVTTMSAKDKTASFDFTGTYTEVTPFRTISYKMDKVLDVQNERTCTVTFIDLGGEATKVEEEFDPEDMNPIEMQQAGWQAILENFKKFVESN